MSSSQHGASIVVSPRCAARSNLTLGARRSSARFETSGIASKWKAANRSQAGIYVEVYVHTRKLPVLSARRDNRKMPVLSAHSFGSPCFDSPFTEARGRLSDLWSWDVRFLRRLSHVMMRLKMHRQRRRNAMRTVDLPIRVCLTACVVYAVGCAPAAVKTGPSYAELVVTYNAEVEALDRLGSEARETGSTTRSGNSRKVRWSTGQLAGPVGCCDRTDGASCGGRPASITG